MSSLNEPYLVRVELAQPPEGAGVLLHPGMPAEVLIATGSRTVLDYIASPLLRALERAGRES